MVRIGRRTVAAYDLGVIGAGVLLLLVSFLRWFGNRYAHFNAWGSGFFAYTGVELGLVAAGIAAVAAFTAFQFPRFRVTWGVIIFGLSALGTLFILLKMAFGFYSAPRAIGLWLSLLVSIGETVVAYQAFSTRGETLGLRR
jgi:hypothetical protein